MVRNTRVVEVVDWTDNKESPPKEKKPKKKMENPLEKREKLPDFTEKYEEALKRKLFEEDLEKMKNKSANGDGDEEESAYYETDRKLVHHKRDGEWDVPISEEIKYFDPELSYEITGYRPINMTQGLDFDPKPFQEVGRIYDTTGAYTEYPPKTKPYNDFWTEQLRRCTEGYTVGKYRITGDHYFFLNFYRMQTVAQDAIKDTTGRNESFPSFVAKQYEFFHYIEICEYIGKDVCLLKSRGLGASEMLASLAVRPFITTRKFRTLLTAATDDQLDPLLDKAWLQLNWLNTHTNGGMKRSRQKIDNIRQKRASLVDKEGNERGRLSEIEGIIANNPRKIRGDRVERLFFEECFDPDTLVIMSDYSRKKISDIKVGDFVMGVDGSPQEVIRTTSGIDDMYEVSQNKGEPYIVNSQHKLYVESRPRTGGVPDTIKEITCPEYEMLSNYNKRTTYGLKSPGLEFHNGFSDIIDPYFLGLWLGDGTSAGVDIVVNETKDPEIRDFVLEYYNRFLDKCKIRKTLNSTTKIGRTKDVLYNYALSGQRNGPGMNYVLNEFKKYNLINNKHIPREIFFTPIETRLQVLAGLIDTDGNLKKGSCSYSFNYEIAMSRPKLIDEIAELARSCGFYVKQDDRIMHNGYKDGSHSYRVIIRGDLDRIPVRVARKRRPSDYKQTTNALSTGIHIKKLGPGKYVGITLNSYGKKYDNLFLLNDYTIVHNCGSNTTLIKSWIQGTALVELGGKKIGIKIALGTGGDDGPQLAGLAKLFNNPVAYNVLPYKNSYTMDGKIAFTGFFIPAYEFALDEQFVDSRGVTDRVRFKARYEEKRASMEGQDLLTYCAEYCFTPNEALLKQGDNLFNAELLSDQITQIRVFKNYVKPEPTALVWDGNNEGKVKAIPSRSSKLLVVEPPLLDKDGQPYKNLYVAGIDSIDVGTNESAMDYDVSDFCIVIKKRMFGMDQPKYVAMYKDRPGDVREAYEMARKLLTWYNAKAMLEYTKIGIQRYFQNKNCADVFMARPEYATTVKNRMKTSKRLIGLPATEAVIKHGIELIGMYVNEYVSQIDFDEMLEQLLNYSYEDKRKFDIVAALGQCEIADEELTGVTPTSLNVKNKQWKDVGYFRNEKGYLEYGVIPSRNQWETRWVN